MSSEKDSVIAYLKHQLSAEIFPISDQLQFDIEKNPERSSIDINITFKERVWLFRISHDHFILDFKYLQPILKGRIESLKLQLTDYFKEIE